MDPIKKAEVFANVVAAQRNEALNTVAALSAELEEVKAELADLKQRLTLNVNVNDRINTGS